MNSSRSTDFKVGIFVTMALLVGSALIFALGNRSAMFAPRVSYRVSFSDVSGLRPGSPVRLSGIEVGTVSAIEFASDGRCSVTIGVRRDAAHLVTAPRDAATGAGGTVASLGSKGLLGDALVDLTPGTGTPLAADTEIPVRQSAGFAGALASAGALLDEAQPAVENVRAFTAALADAQFRQDLHAISHNLAEITRLVSEGDGTVPRLLRDPELAEQVENTLGAVQVATHELAQTARNVRAITAEIEDGEGSAHQIIYGPDGARLVRNLADTAGEAATVIRDVRTGDGNAHELLYGDSAGDLISNLTALSGDARAVMADVRAGRGTLGGLLVDPSIYEDIKRITGNLERNDILRALVRYSIRQDEAAPPAPRPSAGAPRGGSSTPAP